MSDEKKRYWGDWWRAALIRAVRTIAQTAVGMIAVGAGLHEVNWIYVGSVSITAGILSLLTSLTGLPEVKPEEESKDEGMDDLVKAWEENDE